MSGGGSKSLTWIGLRAATPARIGLGRSGVGLPTAAHLDFQLAHARARDAVHAKLETARIVAEICAADLEPLTLQSAAGDLATYLRRPDLGRRLDRESRARLDARPVVPIDILFIIGDGLSATAVNAHAVPLLLGTIAKLSEPALRIGPVAVVEGARVAIGDVIGGVR